MTNCKSVSRLRSFRRKYEKNKEVMNLKRMIYYYEAKIRSLKQQLSEGDEK